MQFFRRVKKSGATRVAKGRWRASPKGYYQGDNPEQELARVNANATVANLIPDSWMPESFWLGLRKRD